MSDQFRAVAIDYDGTLTRDDRPTPGVLAAVDEVRRSGRKVVLVTGRIVAELRGVFAAFEDAFDAVVAENGAVIHRRGVSRGLAAPVPFELDRPLIELGIPFRRGQVLLACDAEHELAVLRELRRLGSDCQLVRNRGALMVLPAGVSKGSGLLEALGELGISPHNALGIGDAENDISLLERCEVGVAVGNSVASLAQHADVTLTAPDGEGVERLLRGPLLEGELLVEPRRWRVELGRGTDGDIVRVPASGINLLVAGGSGAGKSYAAGLLAERLIELGYSVCVFDPEGDHAPLGRLRGVVGVGGRAELPRPEMLPPLLQQSLGSLVVDLSQTPAAEHDAYVTHALDLLRDLRASAGIPHWIVIDEAHTTLRPGSAACLHFEPAQKGFCMVTYRPEDLCGGALQSFDFLLAVAGEKGFDPATFATLTGEAGVPAEARGDVGSGQALLVRLGAKPQGELVDLGERWVRHVRHWHKYASAQLPWERRFHFRDATAGNGVAAANLAEFHRELAHCAAAVIAYHLARGDFSRWVEGVVQDSQLAAQIRAVEVRSGPRAPVETLRTQLLQAIEARYLE